MRHGLPFGVVLCVVLGALFAWLAGTTAPASAHDVLVGSQPAEGQQVAEAPEIVTLGFNEDVLDLPGGNQATLSVGGAAPVVLPVEAAGREVRLRVPAAARTEAGDWVVAYRVVSADGHPVDGELSFRVLAPAAPSEPTATPSPAASPVPTAVRTPATPAPASAAGSDGGAPWWPWMPLGIAVLAALVAWWVAVSARRGRGRPPASS